MSKSTAKISFEHSGKTHPRCLEEKMPRKVEYSENSCWLCKKMLLIMYLIRIILSLTIIIIKSRKVFKKITSQAERLLKMNDLEDSDNNIFFAEEDEFQRASEGNQGEQNQLEIDSDFSDIQEDTKIDDDDSENENEKEKTASGVDNKNYYETTIKNTFTKTVKSINQQLLNIKDKNDEIKEISALLRGFENWFLANDRNLGEEDDRDNRNVIPENDNKPLFDFVVYDQEMNAFLMPFCADVHINVVVKKPRYRFLALPNLARYLRMREPDAYIQEFLADNRSSRRKIIFRYLNGKGKYILMVNIELHVRFHTILKLYVGLDDRFWMMGIFLSYWAYKRGLWKDDYLSAQTLYLMIIYFLMVQSPPILPNLYNEKLGDYKEFTVKGIKGVKTNYKIKIDLNYETDNIKIKEKMANLPRNTMTEGELLSRFFYMFAHEIPKLGRTISVKRGRLVAKKPINGGYSVEDLFDETFDTCPKLNSQETEACQSVRKEFIRAYDLIKEGKIKDLCQSYT